MLPPRHPATRYDAHRQHPNQHPMGKTQRTVSEPMLKVGLQKQLSFNENAKMDLKQGERSFQTFSNVIITRF